MIQALAYGLLTGISLSVGSMIGVSGRVPSWLAGVLLAFATGALMFTTATELIQRPLEDAPAWAIGGAVALGSLSFLGIDAWAERGAGEGGGIALLVGVMVDGIPENLALGSSIGPTLLYAIVAANVPEALTGARDMHEDNGWSKTRIVGIWTVGGVLLTSAVIGGYFLTEQLNPALTATIQAFAGGAVIAALFSAAVPEGREQGGPWAAMATATGFFLAAAIA